MKALVEMKQLIQNLYFYVEFKKLFEYTPLVSRRINTK